MSNDNKPLSEEERHREIERIKARLREIAARLERLSQ